MRKLGWVAALAAACTGGAHAGGGPADGIYSCSAGSSSGAIISVVGYPDGRSVFALAALSATESFGGVTHGIGQVSGTTFFGNVAGGWFNWTLAGTQLAGNISWFDTMGGDCSIGRTCRPALNVACTKIF